MATERCLKDESRRAGVHKGCIKQAGHGARCLVRVNPDSDLWDDRRGWVRQLTVDPPAADAADDGDKKTDAVGADEFSDGSDDVEKPAPTESSDVDPDEAAAESQVQGRMAAANAAAAKNRRRPAVQIGEAQQARQEFKDGQIAILTEFAKALHIQRIDGPRGPIFTHGHTSVGYHETLGKLVHVQIAYGTAEIDALDDD